ncbi:FadR/GntR family transcriptional regulator [Bacillus sp. CGMCC 1.16541]|uniref:FadR/GntR family transcriptional regulator n=1 Tax=Bacillus sp. CGMCC 1.16541 TaxID=2185143 RepID=UPI000D7316F7|nr:FadR/GntR family transcriptional regulator [Bacillus sp. CGMCC 1.16541]
MEYKRIKPRKIYEEVAEALLHSIKSGDLKPGDRLASVQQLAENFQVGRSAIREALSALRAMGLVEMKQGEGTYVRQFDPEMLSLPITSAVLMNKQDIEHLLEVRKVLEVGAVGTAAMKRNEQQLQQIAEVLEQMKDAFGNQELGEKADFDFHMAIAEASQNPLLVKLMNNVSEMMIETMRETRRIWLYSEQTTAERIYEEHKQIYEAIAEQNVQKAQERMLAHLVNVEQVLMQYIREEHSNG